MGGGGCGGAGPHIKSLSRTHAARDTQSQAHTHTHTQASRCTAGGCRPPTWRRCWRGSMRVRTRARACTHKDIHAPTHPHTHTHTPTPTPTHAYARTCTHTHARTRARARAHTHTHSANSHGTIAQQSARRTLRAGTMARAHTQMHAYAHTLSRARTDAHTRRQPPVPSPGSQARRERGRRRRCSLPAMSGDFRVRIF